MQAEQDNKKNVFELENYFSCSKPIKTYDYKRLIFQDDEQYTHVAVCRDCVKKYERVFL